MGIEDPVPINTYPELNLNGQANLVERGMYVTDRNPLGDVQQPPQHPIWTNLATGGCVPICAAELTTAPRAVRWIYLFHGYGDNEGRNIATNAANVNNVYVAFVVDSSKASYDNATTGQGSYFRALDPNDRIPTANALLIYGDHNSLGISVNANLGVLPGNARPTAPARGGGRSKKCFISTAACSALGLPDDCDELATLRWYRDAILLPSEPGRREVEAYYAVAPSIVEAINRRPDCRRVYEGLYWQYIRTAVDAIRECRHGEAYALFKELVREASQQSGRDLPGILRRDWKGRDV
jgi:hypothetical protein